MSSEAQQFFNSIAGSYKSKYDAAQPFHYYFFTERLAEATREVEIENKQVLDVGAGTGDLYDYLMHHYRLKSYHASDVASEMLANSRIPKEAYCVGNIYETDYAVRQFDLAFMLGVTTYLSAEELEKNFQHIASLLKPGGKFIVTFTNRHSLDWFMRWFLKLPVRILGGRKRVLANVKIYPLSRAEAEMALSKYFNVTEARWLNHTVFPSYILLKKPMVWLAKKLHKPLQQSVFSSLLSSDVLLVSTVK